MDTLPKSYGNEDYVLMEPQSNKIDTLPKSYGNQDYVLMEPQLFINYPTKCTL